MQCTSARIFGLEAALYLYYNRGSVVTHVVTMAPWRCAEVEDGDIGNNDLFSTVLLSGRRPASIH